MPSRWRSGLGGELWAEFFGTFILISFGDGVVAMLWALVGSGRSPAGALQSSGDWLLITWGWALAVAFAVYVVGGISGAHINPAVTLSFAVKKEFPWKKVIPYWIVQVLGAFVGAALVFLVYNNAINHFDQVNHIVKGRPASVATYSTFATFPAPYFGSVLGPLIDQIVGTFFLLLFIFAVVDGFNLGVKANLHPFIIGMVVMAVGVSFGANAGYAINPARDFGPRIFAWIAGWGKVAMPGDYLHISGYFWVPIVGPLIGGALAAPVYNFGIRDILFARRRAAEMTEPGPGVEEPPAV
ncbi:MAG TPA: MIP/aquaporin family protein, partial [Solirubrobacteraceae bacterium]